MIEKTTWLQVGACVSTPVVSGLPFDKDSKVQIAMYRVAAWRFGPSGQRRPIRKIQSPTLKAWFTKNSNRSSCVETLDFWYDRESTFFSCNVHTGL